jgi:hypothetical protein
MVPNMSKDNLEFQDFLSNHVNPYVDSLERSRKRYLKKFKLYSLLALIVIVILPFFEPYLTQLLDEMAKNLHNLTGNNVYESQAYLVSKLLYIYAVVLSLFLAVRPVFNYRRHTKKIKVGAFSYIPAGTFSFKEVIFNHLLKYFGKFTFQHAHGSANLDPKSSLILPEYDQCLYEDSIEGVFNNSKIEMSETKLIKYHNGKNVAVFNGMIIMIDVCNPSLVLRGPFKGKTIIIQDENKDSGYINKKFGGYERVNLPNKILEARFEALTTNKEEAKSILSEGLLNSILQLASIIRTSTKQVTHIDDKIMFFFTEKVKLMGSILLQIIWIPFGIISAIRGGTFSMGWYIEPFSASKHTDIYKETLIDNISSVQSINNDVTCSFYDDKVLLTVPYEHDLFEPNSIFEPTLVEEDLHLLFNVMDIVRKITDQICDNKNNFTGTLSRTP